MRIVNILRRKSCRERQRGFTLIELMATLTVLLIMTLVAAPSIGRAFNESEESKRQDALDMIERAAELAYSDKLGSVHNDESVRYTLPYLIENGYLADIPYKDMTESVYVTQDSDSKLNFVHNDGTITYETREVVKPRTAYDVLETDDEPVGYDVITREPQNDIVNAKFEIVYNKQGVEIGQRVLSEDVIQEGRNGQRVVGTLDVVDWSEWFASLPDEYVLAQDSDFTWNALSSAPNAYDDDNDAGTPNVNGYFQYTGSDTHVIVPETVKGNVLKDAYMMFKDSFVQGVAMNNESVTSMGHMFGRTKATVLDLSHLNTSHVTNMSQMFQMSYATSLDLSHFDTSNVTAMNTMFAASRATSLDLGSFDTSKVMNMRNMFASSYATMLDLSSFDTSNVTDMSDMFKSSKVRLLDLNHFDTANVTNMSYMFQNTQATSLRLSNFDTSNVTNMRYMFDNAQATSLNLSSFDTANVINMMAMFRGSQATSLDLSSFDTSNVTDMTYMFESSQATSLNLSSFDTSKLTNMRNMFKLSQVIALDLSNFDTSKVTNMSDMFDSSQVTSLNLSSFDTSNVTSMSRMFANSQVMILDLSNFTVPSGSSRTSSMFEGAKTTSGYAKQSYLVRLNNTSNKPSTLTFTVKP